MRNEVRSASLPVRDVHVKRTNLHKTAMLSCGLYFATIDFCEEVGILFLTVKTLPPIFTDYTPKDAEGNVFPLFVCSQAGVPSETLISLAGKGPEQWVGTLRGAGGSARAL